MAERRNEFITSISKIDGNSIVIRGKDLTKELMGSMGFAEFIYFYLRGRAPTQSEIAVLRALLISLVDHGITANVLAARLTHYSSPESLQGAVASGLLGAGSKFLGTIEKSARMLQGFLPIDSKNPDSTSKLAQSLVNEYLMGSKLIPGLGHPDYKRHDPRALRLWDIAKENNLYGKYSRLIASVSEEASRYSRKILPVNLAGAGASVLSDIGFHWSVQRGFALIGRTVGLVGHLWEEMSEPMSANLMDQVRRRVKYKSSMD